MKSKLFLCLTMIFGGGTLISTRAAQSQPLPALQVVVIPSRTNVHVWEPFNLKLGVKNPTGTIQTIRLMSCSWPDEWQCDNTNVSLGPRPACAEDHVVDMGISPSATYMNELQTSICNLIPNQELSFRMGFTSVGSTNALWSNEVKLHVLPPKTFPPDTWKNGAKYYRDRNHDGKIDWEVSGETWRGDSIHPHRHFTIVTNSGRQSLTFEVTGRGVDIYKVDTNYDGFYDLEYGAGGTNGQIQWTKPIHEPVPEVGKDFVPVEKESWMDQWTESNLGTVLKGIEQRLPELKATWITAGPSQPDSLWQGAETGVALFGRDMKVAVSRYASASNAQQAIKNSMVTRQSMPPPKQNYKGATLYRYPGGGTIICQADDYDIEITSGGDASLMMKVLDAILDQLDDRRDGSASATNANSQIAAQQTELCQLLAEASPGNTTGLSAAKRADREFSPYLSKSENERLLALLRNPNFTKMVTRDQALAAIEQRQLDYSLPSLQYGALLDLVNRKWPHDPVVISFYRDALASRGAAAISDLRCLPGIWDDSLFEPIVQFIEKDAPHAPPGWTAAAPGRVRWNDIEYALAVLDSHYSIWATNASIPPRLSAAVLTIFPSLTNTASPGPRPGDQMWCNAVRMLTTTHDRAMIPVLRPYLKNKSIAGDGTLWLGKDRTPVRTCDQAAVAIQHLLEHTVSPPWAVSGAMFRNVRTFYPQWDEWDKKIAALEKRLDALANK